MARAWIPVGLTGASVGLLAACAFGGVAAEAVFGVLVMAFAPLLMLLGVGGAGDRGGPDVAPILLLLLSLEISLAGLWMLRGEVESAPWWLGLPAATAIQLCGLLLLPLAIVTLGFAATFRRFDVSDREIEELRRLAPTGDE